MKSQVPKCSADQGQRGGKRMNVFSLYGPALPSGFGTWDF